MFIHTCLCSEKHKTENKFLVCFFKIHDSKGNFDSDCIYISRPVFLEGFFFFVIIILSHEPFLPAEPKKKKKKSIICSLLV